MELPGKTERRQVFAIPLPSLEITEHQSAYVSCSCYGLLNDTATTKLKQRCYKGKDYVQKKVDKCFEGPKHYLYKVFGCPQFLEKESPLEFDYALN